MHTQHTTHCVQITRIYPYSRQQHNSLFRNYTAICLAGKRFNVLCTRMCRNIKRNKQKRIYISAFGGPRGGMGGLYEKSRIAKKTGIEVLEGLRHSMSCIYIYMLCVICKLFISCAKPLHVENVTLRYTRMNALVNVSSKIEMNFRWFCGCFNELANNGDWPKLKYNTHEHYAWFGEPIQTITTSFISIWGGTIDDFLRRKSHTHTQNVSLSLGHQNYD